MKNTHRPATLSAVIGIFLTSCLLLSNPAADTASHSSSPPADFLSQEGRLHANPSAISYAQQMTSSDPPPRCPNSMRPPGASIKTDGGTYREPLLPVLPKSGCKFFDPTFGTELMRVTDEEDGPSNSTYYSYWPTFNSNNTRLLVRHSNSASIYNFDPQAFTLDPTSKREVPAPSVGVGLLSQGAIWSSNEPNILYGISSASKLWELDTEAMAYSPVRDFTGDLGANEWLDQMSKSDDNRLFAFSIKTLVPVNGEDEVEEVGYIIYDREAGQILRKEYALGRDTVSGKDYLNNLDEVQLDKSGTYLVIATSTSGFVLVISGSSPPVEITNLPTGHSDVGTGTLVGYYSVAANKLLKRSLATPNDTPVELLNMGDYQQNVTLSLRGTDESWSLVGFNDGYTPLSGQGKFHRELILVKNDGSGQIRRIAHHRSIFAFGPGNGQTDYWAIPHANMSRDGRFVAFSSNWGAPQGINSRVDLFIARIDGATSAPPTSPPPDPTTGALNGWSAQSINEGKAGAASYSGGTFAVNGSGAQVWGGSDGLHFVYKELPNPGEIVARVSSLDFGTKTAKAGVMVRSGLTPEASNMFIHAFRNAGEVEYSYRHISSVNQGTSWGARATNPTYWMKVSRQGNQFTPYVFDGSNWVPVGTGSAQTLDNSSGTVYAGLAVSSSDNALLRQATFDGVYVGAPLSSTPPAAPTNLRVEELAKGPDSNSGIYLRWDDNAANETGYTIERRSLVNGQLQPWVTLNVVGPNVNYYHLGWGNCTENMFRVKASNPPLGSAYSNELYSSLINCYWDTEPTTTTCTPPTSLLISAFRFRGPQGPNDEFIELYNNSDSPVTVCTADQSGGWTLAARSTNGLTTSLVFGLPAGMVIPARGYFLGVNVSPGGYGGAATGNTTFTRDIEDNSGIALFKTANLSNFTAANRLDAVGFSGASGAIPDLYREGAGLQPAGAGSDQQTFSRKIPQDTGNNSADFVLLQGVNWINKVNVTASAGTLQKTGGCSCYDAGAISQQQVNSAGGHIEFRVSEGHRMLVGLGNDASGNTGYENIGYMLNFWGDGWFDVREGWSNYRAGGTYTSGDVFRIAVEAGAVTYYKNGIVVYASTAAPAYPLVFDTALVSPGAALYNASMVVRPLWASQDIGSVGPTGSFNESAGTFTIQGAGADIWSGADAFHYVYQPLNGDGEIVARVAGFQNTNQPAKAGVMIRESLSAGSRHAFVDITPAWGLEFLYRSDTDGNTTYGGGASISPPQWVRLVRSGNSFSGYYKTTAEGPWVSAGTATINMTSGVYVGLAVNSHSNSSLCTVTFDSVTITRP